MSTSIVVLGVRETQAKLAAKMLAVIAASGPACETGGRVVQAAMVELAPRNTGRLANSIEVSVDQEKEGATSHIGATVPYDRFIQFGTRYMSAQAYGERAAQVAGSPVAAVVASVYKRVL